MSLSHRFQRYAGILLVLFMLFAGRVAGFKHPRDYQKFGLSWQRLTAVGRVYSVHPHPLFPDRVLAYTAGGLKKSEDGGRTWKAMAADKVEDITDIAFSPYAVDTFYLSTEDSGVWASRDNGKTFKQVGTKANGMAADEVVHVYLDSTDQEYRTIIAVHGDAAPGISQSRDGGRTWRVFGTRYHVHDIQFGQRGRSQVFVVAASVRKPDLHGVYYGVALTDYWYEVIRDVQVTGHGIPVHASRHAFFATQSGRLHVAYKNRTETFGPTADGPYAAVGVTRGPTEDHQIMFAYQPTKLGMITTRNRFREYQTHNTGLHVQAFTRDGSQLRPNANGSLFFAVANRVLYRGVRHGGVHPISGLSVKPPVFKYHLTKFNNARSALQDSIEALSRSQRAADHAAAVLQARRDMTEAVSQSTFTLTAKVAGAAPPKAVTVDLSRLRHSSATPMYDDGKHGDGAAGDRVYGVVFHLRPDSPCRVDRDWRVVSSGPFGLTVTAVGADQQKSGAVALLGVYRRLDSFRMYDGWSSQRAKGAAAGEHVDIRFPGHRRKRRCTRVTVTGEGEWEWSAGSDGRSYDITGFYALSILIRASRETNAELRLQLRDNPLYAEAVTTGAVDLIEAGGGKPLTTEWRRIVVPLAGMADEAELFRQKNFGYVILSGDGRETLSYEIAGIRFHRTREELETTEKQ